MKKLLSIILAAGLLASISTTAFASEINQDTTSKTADVKITTNIDPTYVVTIPESTAINFNATSTALGTVKATSMQIEANKKIVVLASADAFKNTSDASKTIAYKLMNGSAEFSSIDILTTADKADLTVAIDKSAWDSAYAGAYSGVITFTLSYENA